MIKNASFVLLGAVAALSIASTACSDGSAPASSAGGGSTTSATTSAGTGMAAPSCDAYCAEVMANCNGAATQQYKDMASCMGACAAFPAGTSADMSGNTLGCREYHGGAPAMGDPTTHCPHAGPSGAPLCGKSCEGFCEIAMKACTGAMAAYSNESDCMTKCMAFDDTVPYNANVTSGNSLACRIYHATVATVDPATHCPHIGVDSPVCK